MTTTSLTWFARHEIRLAWREWLAMMTAGRRGRTRAAVIGLIVLAAFLHLPAYAVIGRFANLQAQLDKSSLIVITATIFLAWALMLSQAIESVTRVFYARADLDLIMSSPVALANVFSVRIAAIALSVSAMALLLSTPFVDVLVIGGGIRWFAAYGVVIAIGLSAAAVAIAVTIMLFRSIGPRRTRLVAQILAAIIGAGFVIALQIAAILSYGTLSRFAVLTSDAAAAFAPDTDSMVWWPARAALGDGEALLLLLAGGLVLLGAVMAMFSARFADTAVSAARLPHQGIPFRLTAAGAAAQGIRAAAARSVAGVAKPDATALPGAAGADAVAKFCRQFGRHRADHARYRNGGRSTRRRSGMADHLRRRRDGSGGDRAASMLARDPRQDRSGADRDRCPVRATGHRADVRLAAASGRHRGRRYHRSGVCNRDPALVSRAGPAQPVSPPPDIVTAGDLRGGLFIDRMGCDRGTGARNSLRWSRQRPVDGRHHRGDLEDQPAAGVTPLCPTP
jgi:hypothetical protein